MTKLLIVNTSDTVYNNPNFAMQLHPGYAVVVDADDEAVKAALLDHADKLEKVGGTLVDEHELGVALPLNMFQTLPSKKKVEEEQEDTELEVVNKPAPRGRQKS